jgi:hypothetical protein
VLRAAPRKAQVFLLAVEGQPFSAGGPQLAGGELLRVRASDVGAGVESLELHVAATDGDGQVLEAVATDRVGNGVTIAWPLRRR